MKRVLGFAVFFIAFGVVLGMMIPNTFWEIIIVMVCLLIGYNLFCC